ncbi:hypothetical protein CL654_00760 [bacterium]|nr:hypothetical protein [bacterium]|tara:strand:- start:14355 stop:16163 length:1809 start_codon:yes stop_codon:yes gene_type:complete
MKQKGSQYKKGLTLIEVLITAVIFLMLALAIYQGYVASFEVIRSAKLKTIASLLANEQIELIRNLPYEDVGVMGSIPDGIILGTQQFTRSGVEFTVNTVIRNIDDPFDGTIGGVPDDLSPADYRLVELEVSCPACQDFETLLFTARVAPIALETSTGNGALFVQVFNASGQPLQGMDVLVENNTTASPISISDVTDANGFLQLVDVPPGIQVWEVTVSEPGYSSAQTYPPGEMSNPNPTKPHATVATGTVTQISFAVDTLATLNIESKTQTCSPTGNVSFDMTGTKLIGSSPDVYKYQQSHSTDAGGSLTLPNIEWDTYSIDLTDETYDLAGSIPFLLFSVTPGAQEDLLLVTEPLNPNSLLISVTDGGTSLPLSDATVTLSATSTSFNETLLTSQGYLRQTDWSGGSGQASFVDETRYFSSDGNIETNLPSGELKLKQVLGDYVPNGELISSTFDTGATTTDYFIISWEPESQPVETGTDPVRFQVATNNDGTTWNYIGPDGTGSSYYDLANTTLHTSHNNNQFLRYKILLSTASSTYTPNISDVAVTYSSECIPFGQTYFNGLTAGGYTISISKTGYQDFTQDITISSGWQLLEVDLLPE